MTSKDPFMVSLYLHGENLDPTNVSQQLGVESTRSHYKGQKIVTSSNREIIKKAGVWVLVATTKSETLSDHIEELAKMLKVDGKRIEQIDGVEDAYIDIFMCTIRSKEDSNNSEFELSKENIAALSNFGLRVQFTVTSVDS